VARQTNRLHRHRGELVLRASPRQCPAKHGTRTPWKTPPDIDQAGLEVVASILPARGYQGVAMV